MDEPKTATAAGGAPSPEQLLASTLRDIEREFPRFRIVRKQTSRLSRVIDLALKLVTLGGQSRYLTHYHTVIGDTLYVPPEWDRGDPVDRAITLRHERVHLRQRRRMTSLGLALWYLLPILPLGLAYGRARIEWEAYRETILATAELKGIAAARHPELRQRITEQFTSAAYGWMWPFPKTIHRWIDEALREADRRHGAKAAGTAS
ncbi:MAG: hypothetical protein JRI23_08655 [Deltaproteobacteria bacterium]|jgi:hypothetical protein|nr:hypothetical protein [Deltaproteobacteria bacterium]MBW2531683.1 hypothetical protein [Deltaproteobacteria bacterium]